MKSTIPGSSSTTRTLPSVPLFTARSYYGTAPPTALRASFSGPFKPPLPPAPARGRPGGVDMMISSSSQARNSHVMFHRLHALPPYPPAHHHGARGGRVRRHHHRLLHLARHLRVP